MIIRKSRWEKEESALLGVAGIYCRVWEEPPWNEDFWTIGRVIQDLHKELMKPNAVLLYATEEEDREITGFTWGYETSISDLSDISGAFKSQWERIVGEKRAFYIDELGVDRKYRQCGFGLSLTQELLRKVTNLDIDYATLRTDIKAVAARSLYKKMEFQELSITDVEHPDRTYWLKDLKGKNSKK